MFKNLRIYKKITLKRFSRRLKQKKNYKKRQKDNWRYKNRGKNKKTTHSHLDSDKNYNKQTIYKKSSIIRRKEYINFPNKFCLINNHDETFEFLESIPKKLDGNTDIELAINHEKVELIGLSASFLFDKIISNYMDKWSKTGINYRIKGRISKYKDVNNFLLSYGFFNLLNITVTKNSPLYDIDYKDKFYAFKKEGNILEQDVMENTSVELSQYFIDCLQDRGYHVSDNIFEKLINATGEILGNAQEHSGDDNETWYVRAIFNKETLECKFSIINYGHTIYQNLTAKEILNFRKENFNLNELISVHSKRQDVPSTDYEEPLTNLLAIQDGISSAKTKSGKRSSRGQGFLDFIEIIAENTEDNDNRRISIISGKSKILIDFEYRINYVKNKGRTLWFNNNGSFKLPQDMSKIIKMNHNFDGAIITGKFNIKRDKLTKLL